MQQEPLRRFEWERVVKRCHIPPTTKYVALTIATFADQDGSRVHPGEIKLAADLGMSARNVRRHMARLRDEYALIERTRFHGSRRAYADEYQLVMPDDLTERVRFTDDPELKVVDNSPERETGETNHRTSRTESPDTSVQITGHGCPATRPRPPTDQNKTSDDHGAEVEGSSALAVSLRPNQHHEHYAAAAAALQAMPDLGSELMHRAREDIGDAPMRQLVVYAAQLAKEPP